MSLEKAKVQLILKEPFFGTLLLHTTMVGRKDIPTAQIYPTGKIEYNPEWVGKLTLAEQMSLLCHEVMHFVSDHFRRQGHRRNHKKWLMATDYAINIILHDMGLQLPKDGLLSEKYRGMAAEQVYDVIPDSDPEKVKVWIDVLAPGEGSGGAGGKKPVDLDQLGETWKRRVIQAMHVARMQGKLPGVLERYLKDLLNPRINWREILEKFVAEYVRDDYDGMNFDRRLIEYELYFEDLQEQKAQVAVAIDCSGSVGDEEVKHFLSEAASIVRCRNVSRMRILSCDAAVHYDEVVDVHSFDPAKVPLMRGGTDFRPVFEAIEKKGDKPALLVYMTDLFGTFPNKAPAYPVIWLQVLQNGAQELPDHYRPPFGHLVPYEVETGS